MTLTGNFIYLNHESMKGIKDPTKENYYILLMDGTETLRVFTTKELYETIVSNVDQYSKLTCTFAFNPTFKSIRLVAIA